MNTTLIITIILGLVFQLAQVLPGAVVTASCARQTESCECCAGLDSCPCAENGGQEQKPSPTVPDTGRVLKLQAAKPGETRVSIDSRLETRSSAVVAAVPAEGPPAGYGGIRLSVAFCSFVI